MAGIMYYFFTASFVWMMIEGLQLYTQVVLVFNQESSKMRYYLLGGWGMSHLNLHYLFLSNNNLVIRQVLTLILPWS